MKKSDKENMNYDGMGLRLGVALESVVEQLPQSVNIHPDDSLKRKAITLRNYFRDNGADKHRAGAVVRVVEERNKIAHPGKSGVYRPYLNRQGFRKMREDCMTIDELLMEFCGIAPENLPMSNLMFHSLPYDMGNAGDLIKHGALVHFVHWWFDENGKYQPFRFADPFGGCPWEVVEKDEVKGRMRKLKAHDSIVGGCLWRGDKRYYNSGHIVNFAAVHQCGGKAMVRTSDASDIARSDLMASSIHADDMELLGKNYRHHKCNDGYSILPHAEEFDLVLLDPFREFLHREAKRDFPILKQIKGIAEKPASDGRNVCIAVFVLDWFDNHIHDNYVEFKKRELRDIGISLRCPKMEDSKVKGESNYNMEMLLISKAFANGGGWRLRNSLDGFSKAAGKALFPLGDKTIELWPPK